MSAGPIIARSFYAVIMEPALADTASSTNVMLLADLTTDTDIIHIRRKKARQICSKHNSVLINMRYRKGYFRKLKMSEEERERERERNQKKRTQTKKDAPSRGRQILNPCNRLPRHVEIDQVFFPVHI